MIEIYPVRAFTDNYIWMIVDAKNKHVWAVDPGEAEPVISFIEEKGLILKGVLLTHHHADHSAGIPRLVTCFPELIVYGSELSPIKTVTHHLNDEDAFRCGNFKFTALAIPGHTLDHIAFLCGQALFCGDALFSAGCGKIFEGTPKMMHESLMKLAMLDDSVKIYCGHEYTLDNLKFATCIEPNNQFILKKIKNITTNKNPCTLPSTISDEKNINPFLRCDNSEVVTACQTHVNKSRLFPVDVFTVLREWKNNFI